MTKLTVECGHCGKTLGLKQRLLGQTTECKACHSQCDVQPDGRVTVQPAAQTIPDTPTEAAKGDAPELLEWLEDLFVKMIYGIFKFTFVRLPREIWRFLVKAFPTLMRALKVLLLGLLWVALAVGPFMWTQFHKQIADSQLPGYAWYCDHQFTVNCLLDVYSVSALIGSVWGIYYINADGASSCSPAGLQPPAFGRTAARAEWRLPLASSADRCIPVPLSSPGSS